MTAARSQDLRNFIHSTYRSVWAIELLCVLTEPPVRNWAPAELLATLRASEFVVSQSSNALMAAGLVIVNSDTSIRYQPASPKLDAFAHASIDLYRRTPDAVRRLIISGTAGAANAFADAFKFRND